MATTPTRLCPTCEKKLCPKCSRSYRTSSQTSLDEEQRRAQDTVQEKVKDTDQEKLDHTEQDKAADPDQGKAKDMDQAKLDRTEQGKAAGPNHGKVKDMVKDKVKDRVKDKVQDKETTIQRISPSSTIISEYTLETGSYSCSSNMDRSDKLKKGKPRMYNIFPNVIMVLRHTDRLDDFFPNWLQKSDKGGYRAYDLNMPLHLPLRRPLKDYESDPPFTNTGDILARMIGRGMYSTSYVPGNFSC
ncbi:unnamed protein product [Nippostrongylus brasiliensis]|uniref:Phosphoglycerate mutase-like protein n=1 Tax=Nippostrongylus brasiliensis TaxID=27835 RepID=A0A0N4XIS1_NIPBR|nr:unnamed protein product [Nippostrongylus brasiliensis]